MCESMGKIHVPKKHRKVNPICAEQIECLNSMNVPEPKDFWKLKSGGMDGWSRLNEDEIKEEFSKKEIDMINSEALQAAASIKFKVNIEKFHICRINAFRWYGRGLRSDLVGGRILEEMQYPGSYTPNKNF